jgi:hypothetical protein
MAAIIAKTDLPTAIQSAELVDDMVAAANAKASRVAPCLTAPANATAWATTTAYAVDDVVSVAANEYLQVTVAGTSDSTAPTAPELGATVTDGTVTWERVAPTPDQLVEAKLLLIGAVKRWADATAGALQSQTAGPFGITVDTRQTIGYNLRPTEIEELQTICAVGTESSSRMGSFSPSGSTTTHLPWCNLYFGASYCSCGADIAGYPLYEGGVLTGDEY